MAVGTGFAVVCLECIPDEAERKAVVDALKGKEARGVRFLPACDDHKLYDVCHFVATGMSSPER